MARTARLVYIAVSDTPTTSLAAETADDGTTAIPELGDALADDPLRKVRKIAATPDPESPREVFTVVVECSTRGGATILGNPLDEPDRITWDFTDGTEPYFIDNDPEGQKPV